MWRKRWRATSALEAKYCGRLSRPAPGGPVWFLCNARMHMAAALYCAFLRRDFAIFSNECSFIPVGTGGAERGASAVGGWRERTALRAILSSGTRLIEECR
jgi:hypothetical protein